MASTLADAAGDIDKMDVGGESDDESPEQVLEEFTKIYEELKGEWDKGKGRRALKKIGELLDQSKLVMAKLDAFLPKFGHAVGVLEMTNIRTVLEMGAYFSLEAPHPDIDQFMRYTAQLKNYYLDYAQILGESPHKYELLCAKLLCLLNENRVADYHMELALILQPPDQVKMIQRRNPILFKTMKIAEGLEDGRYNAFFIKAAQTGQRPDASTEQGKLALLEAQGDKAIHESAICNYFLDKLVISCRPHIAETLERAYERWPKKFALERLHFKSYAELEEFAAERKWISKDGQNYSYENKHEEVIPIKKLILESLNYAREMDQII